MSTFKLPFLDRNVPIVDADGKPTAQFSRWFQENFSGLNTAQTTAEDAATNAALKTRVLAAGIGLDGGGDLTADRTFDLNASINDLNDVDTATVPPTNGQALVWDADHWEPGSVAGGGGAFELIETWISTGVAGTKTFAAIPQTYRDLQIIVRGRSTTAGQSTPIVISVNGLATGIYDTQRHYVNSDAANHAHDNQLNFTSWSILSAMAAAGSLANQASVLDLRMYDYSGVTFFKDILFRARQPYAATYGAGFLIEGMGQVRTTAAIVSITVSVAGLFVTGSRISLYGIK